MRLLLNIAILGLFTATSWSQKIIVFWEKDTVLVGEKAVLHIEIHSKPKNLEYRPLSGSMTCETKNKSDKLWRTGAQIDILEYHDSAHSIHGKSVWKAKYELMAWDTASYKLPDLWFVKGDTSLSKSVPIIHVLFKKKKVKEGLIEIDISPEEEWWGWIKRYWWILLIPLVIITIAILWNRKRKLKPVKKLSLRERTLLAIAELKKKEDWNHGNEKAHYSAFTSILKSYIGVRFELNLLERTTQETKLLLNQAKIDPSIIERIDALLHEADMIKFAKMPVDDIQARSSLRKLEELIIELSPLDIPA